MKTFALMMLTGAVLAGLPGCASKKTDPADAFFARGMQRTFDLVVAMYHDQGLIPLKAAARGRGVNVTAGLPIVRTSPDHGTAFDIAGRGVAEPASMVAAVRLAGHLWAQRGRFTGRAGR